MIKQINFKKIVFTCLNCLGWLLLLANPLYSLAGNTAINGLGTRAETMQAFVGVADDPSAIYYNPAGIAQIKGTDVESDLTYIKPDNEYTNSLNGFTTHGTKGVIAGDLFATTDRINPVILGIGVYAPFARQTEYTINPAVFNFYQKAKIVQLDIVPTIAMNLCQYVAVGIGIVGSRVSATSDIFGFHESGIGYAATGQAGILIKPIENVRFGISYRGSESAHIDGTGTLRPLGVTDDFTADAKFPAVFSAGASWQIVQQLLVTAEYDNEMWSSVDRFKRNYSNPILNAIGDSPLNGRNSDNYRVGVAYKPIPTDEFRAGYSYLQSSIPAVNIVPAMPDYDISVYSLGYSHYFKKLRLDAGYERATSPTKNSNSPFFPGQYSLRANIFLLGVNYNFG